MPAASRGISLAGRILTASMRSIVRCVSGSNVLKLSISSSSRSIRSGSSDPMGKMSINEPRTAYSPRSATVPTLRYPARCNRMRWVSMEKRPPVSTTSDCASTKAVGGSRCISVCTGATNTPRSIRGKA